MIFTRHEDVSCTNGWTDRDAVWHVRYLSACNIQPRLTRMIPRLKSMTYEKRLEHLSLWSLEEQVAIGYRLQNVERVMLSVTGHAITYEILQLQWQLTSIVDDLEEMYGRTALTFSTVTMY